MRLRSSSGGRGENLPRRAAKGRRGGRLDHVHAPTWAAIPSSVCSRPSSKLDGGARRRPPSSHQQLHHDPGWPLARSRRNGRHAADGRRERTTQRAGRTAGVYHLFSPRAIFAEQGRAQGSAPRRRRPCSTDAGERAACRPALHASSTILSALSLNERENGRLPRFACRVRCDGRNSFAAATARPAAARARGGARPSRQLVRCDDGPRRAHRRPLRRLRRLLVVWSIAADGGGDGDAVGGGPPEAARPLAGVR